MFVLSAFLVLGCSEYGLQNGDVAGPAPGDDAAESGYWQPEGVDLVDPYGDGSPDPGGYEPGDETTEIPWENPYEPPGDDDLPDWPDTFTDDPGENLWPDEDEDRAEKGRMTGGGVVEDGRDYSYGFTLHCAGSHHSNHFQISWDGGSFHLTEVAWIECFDDPDLHPDHPAVGNDTLEGVGWGRDANGRDAEIWFRLQDDGEPGVDDHSAFTIVQTNRVVTSVGYLADGNHQAHDPIK